MTTIQTHSSHGSSVQTLILTYSWFSGLGSTRSSQWNWCSQALEITGQNPSCCFKLPFTLEGIYCCEHCPHFLIFHLVQKRGENLEKILPGFAFSLFFFLHSQQQKQTRTKRRARLSPTPATGTQICSLTKCNVAWLCWQNRAEAVSQLSRARQSLSLMTPLTWGVSPAT